MAMAGINKPPRICCITWALRKMAYFCHQLLLHRRWSACQHGFPISQQHLGNGCDWWMTDGRLLIRVVLHLFKNALFTVVNVVNTTGFWFITMTRCWPMSMLGSCPIANKSHITEHWEQRFCIQIHLTKLVWVWNPKVILHFYLLEYHSNSYIQLLAALVETSEKNKICLLIRHKLSSLYVFRVCLSSRVFQFFNSLRTTFGLFHWVRRLHSTMRCKNSYEEIRLGLVLCRRLPSPYCNIDFVELWFVCIYRLL